MCYVVMLRKGILHDFNHETLFSSLKGTRMPNDLPVIATSSVLLVIENTLLRFAKYSSKRRTYTDEQVTGAKFRKLVK